jgi:hypothetical protein
MFTEYEIDTMMEIPDVKKATFELKKAFCKGEAPYLELTDHDFFSLAMMAPQVGIAKADGSISLFEELALNKRARKLSKGGFFMKKDPVVNGMKFMIKSYEKWEDQFMGLLKLAMQKTFDLDSWAVHKPDDSTEVDYEKYKIEVLRSPYILIRFISSFFLENDEDIINRKHSIEQKEYERMLVIAEKLNLHRVSVFQMFAKTFLK